MTKGDRCYACGRNHPPPTAPHLKREEVLWTLMEVRGREVWVHSGACEATTLQNVEGARILNAPCPAVDRTGP